MDSIIETFHIDWRVIIAQAINFALVFVILYIYALKPLSKLMKERGEKIETGIKDAEQSSVLLEKASEEYEQNSRKLKQMAVDSEKELKKELDELRAKNLEKIKQDNDEWAKKRGVQMEADKKALVEGAKSELVTLAMQAAKKIMAEKNK